MTKESNKPESVRISFRFSPKYGNRVSPYKIGLISTEDEGKESIEFHKAFKYGPWTDKEIELLKENFHEISTKFFSRDLPQGFYKPNSDNGEVSWLLDIQLGEDLKQCLVYKPTEQKGTSDKRILFPSKEDIGLGSLTPTGSGDPGPIPETSIRVMDSKDIFPSEEGVSIIITQYEEGGIQGHALIHRPSDYVGWEPFEIQALVKNVKFLLPWPGDINESRGKVTLYAGADAITLAPMSGTTNNDIDLPENTQFWVVVDE